MIIFLLLCCGIPPLFPADRDSVTFTITADSEVYYTADVRIALVTTSTVKGVNNNINGTIEWISSDLRTEVYADITIDAAEFDSGNSRRDRDVREILNVEEFPYITFELQSILGMANKSLTEISGEYVATGLLTVKGRTKELTIPIQMDYTGGVLTAEGSTAAKYTDFSIDPPRVAGFVSRSPDELRLHVKLIAKRKE